MISYKNPEYETLSKCDRTYTTEFFTKDILTSILKVAIFEGKPVVMSFIDLVEDDE